MRACVCVYMYTHVCIYMCTHTHIHTLLDTRKITEKHMAVLAQNPHHLILIEDRHLYGWIKKMLYSPLTVILPETFCQTINSP